MDQNLSDINQIYCAGFSRPSLDFDLILFLQSTLFGIMNITIYSVITLITSKV